MLDFPSEESPENSASETHDMTQRIMGTCPTQRRRLLEMQRYTHMPRSCSRALGCLDAVSGKEWAEEVLCLSICMPRKLLDMQMSKDVCRSLGVAENVERKQEQ